MPSETDTAPQQQTQPTQVTHQVSPNEPRTFTADEVEKFRADERNKLQAKIDSLNDKFKEVSTQYQTLAETVQERELREAKEAEARTAVLKAEEESELDAKTLLAKREAEWAEKQAQLEKSVADKFAALDLERQYLELKSYTQGRVAQEVANGSIHETFAHYITGNSKEEIEASIQLAQKKSEQLLAEVAQYAQGRTASLFQSGGGVSAKGGPSELGSMAEIQGEEIDTAGMSFADYVKNRDKIQASMNKNSGLFA
jgi:hypothetical protein